MGWIGVDLDGTLAHYTGWQGPGHIGAPIPAMVKRVKDWLADGVEVRIVTARAYSRDKEGKLALNAPQVVLISQWCEQHVGKRLPVQFWKDYAMRELWDDRCVQVTPNTGEPIC